MLLALHHASEAAPMKIAGQNDGNFPGAVICGTIIRKSRCSRHDCHSAYSRISYLKVLNWNKNNPPTSIQKDAWPYLQGTSVHCIRAQYKNIMTDNLFDFGVGDEVDAGIWYQGGTVILNASRGVISLQREYNLWQKMTVSACIEKIGSFQAGERKTCCPLQ